MGLPFRKSRGRAISHWVLDSPGGSKGEKWRGVIDILFMLIIIVFLIASGSHLYLILHCISSTAISTKTIGHLLKISYNSHFGNGILERNH